MKQQDEYCSKVEAGDLQGLGDFPEDLQWESLVDVLRGKVKVRDLDLCARLNTLLMALVSAR